MPKFCEHPGCSKIPNYNHEGETKARFCVQHKTPSMIDIKNKRCEHPGCSKRPIYNHEGETKARFCVQHKTPSMLNVVNKRCEFPGCSKRPTYNNEGETKARFCVQHKTPSMIDIKNKRCEFPGCSKRPTYNHEGETKARFCVQHKTPSMIDIKNKRCEFPGCSKRPNYNNEGETKARFCVQHKTPSMLNVVNKRCEFPGCSKQPGSGYPGHRVTRCAQHREVGMISKPRAVCVEIECREPATHGIAKAVHCIVHAKDPEMSLVGGTCTVCGLIDILDQQYRCSTCNPGAYRRVRLAKQREVKLWFDSAGYGDYVLYDKIVDNGTCGKERPDFAFDCGTHWIVVEVDENQHDDRQESCECARMVNISQSIGMKTVFLRYNPDAFKSAGRKQNPGFTRRRDTLLCWLKHLRENEPQSFLSVVRLFFDDYEAGKIVPTPILV